jgi:hypothetical protein
MEAMRGDGMDFWMDLFAARGDTYVQVWLEAWDPRTNAWGWWTGYLARLTFESVNPAASAAATLYNGVAVRVVECEAA